MILLDSHIWFWWINQDHSRISRQMANAIETADRVGVSAVSCFELALAHRKGRLELPCPPREWFGFALDPSGVELIPLTPAIAERAVALTEIHKDPFDRIIIASALEYAAELMSVDAAFGNYPELAGRLLNG